MAVTQVEELREAAEIIAGMYNGDGVEILSEAADTIETLEANERVIKSLLEMETKITEQIHSAIFEIMRLGCTTDRGRKKIKSVFESIQYILEGMEGALLEIGGCEE